MIFKAPSQPTKTKKIIYLIASTILGILLSFIAHIIIEINYLKGASNHNLVVSFYNGCALLPVFQIALSLLGAVGGFFLGRFWWHKIYIERIWEKKKI
jgi:hypothetical protein